MSSARSAWLLHAVTWTVLTGACSPADQAAPPQSVGERLSGDASGYRKVTRPGMFRFPADHGPHPEYKHEWWYLTGQVENADGRRFGFQFTIFREAISPRPVQSASRWATNQIYLAHVAVTDVAGKRYLSDERYARGALELAGASAEPFRVWLEDWELSRAPGREGELATRVVAAGEQFGFDLEIRNARPPVAHGDRGLSAKGAEDNASYYYSYTRLEAEGAIRIDGESFHVNGSAWFDHEWSSSVLQAHQAGWDWFSLQLSNGTDLMAFRLRHKTDSERDFYNGTVVDPSGGTTVLSSGQIDMQAREYWTSDRTGVRYPTHWRLSVPDLGLELFTEPLLHDQEFAHSFRYWEGAVRVRGRHDGEPVEGRGYLELAGYAANGQR
jgi:predicted secreted hydrolase